jgi:hypothetical protein
VAVTVTDSGLGIVAGAVYTPPDEIDPRPDGTMDQVTAELQPAGEDAANCCVCDA